LFGERNIIDNFSLAMSTLSTGGFLPNSTILQHLVWQEHLILMAAMILGALPFTFHYAFVRKKFMSPKLGKEVLVYFGVLGGATLIFALISGLDPLFSAFYSVSASTTAGLQLEPLDTLASNAQAILIVLMFIGGCGFSTAGGIKIYRFMQLKNFKLTFSKVTRKNLTAENKKEIATTLIILFLFPTISVFTAFHLMDISGADFADSFLDAAGVITTGGLSADVINLETDPATKVALSFLMIIGRLEIIAIVYIFVPRLI
jgi:trk system potassium uptake protein TrkH